MFMLGEDEIFILNNAELEKVSTFKFLGMTIASNYTNKEHIKNIKTIKATITTTLSLKQIMPIINSTP